MSSQVRTILLLGVGLFLAVLFLIGFSPKEEKPTETDSSKINQLSKPQTNPTVNNASSTEIIGKSVEGRNIKSFTFGTGSTSVLFVGGVHGGYEWNSIVLAYEIIEALEQEKIKIPTAVKVHIIPNLNPDGLFLATKLTGKIKAGDIKDNKIHNSGIGRFNANNVDLNRNFDCNWKEQSSWKNNLVSAGTKPFSEPEARALRDYVNKINPKMVIFWHSKANKVYASECNNGVLPETVTLMNTYADAANYGKVEKFTAYPITGDAEGWLASINIPAITVELGSRTNSELEQNLKGVEAVLKQLQKDS